jgi:hypothetical protein
MQCKLPWKPLNGVQSRCQAVWHNTNTVQIPTETDRRQATGAHTDAILAQLQLTTRPPIQTRCKQLLYSTSQAPTLVICQISSSRHTVAGWGLASEQPLQSTCQAPQPLYQQSEADTIAGTRPPGCSPTGVCCNSSGHVHGTPSSASSTTLSPARPKVYIHTSCDNIPSRHTMEPTRQTKGKLHGALPTPSARTQVSIPSRLTTRPSYPDRCRDVACKT